MNALIEVRPALPATETAQALAQAQELIENCRFGDASRLYSELLAQADLEPDLRSEIQTNLAAALCLMAQLDPSAGGALRQLALAQSLLQQALKHRRRAHHPIEWAKTRINLAIVHMTRYARAQDGNDLLSAHLALDGTQAALARHDDAATLDWSRAIQDSLIEMSDRRAGRR